MTASPLPQRQGRFLYDLYDLQPVAAAHVQVRKLRAFIHGRFHNIMLTFRFEYSNILVQCLDEKLQIVRLVESEVSKYEAYNQTDSAGCCGGSLALFGFHAWLSTDLMYGPVLYCTLVLAVLILCCTGIIVSHLKKGDSSHSEESDDE